MSTHSQLRRKRHLRPRKTVITMYLELATQKEKYHRSGFQASILRSLESLFRSDSSQAWTRRVYTTSSSKTSTFYSLQCHSRKYTYLGHLMDALLNLTQTTNGRLSCEGRIRDTQLTQDIHQQHLPGQDHQPEGPGSGSSRGQASRCSSGCGRS